MCTTTNAAQDKLEDAYAELCIYTPRQVEYVGIEDATDAQRARALAYCRIQHDAAAPGSWLESEWDRRYDAICAEAWGGYSQRPFGLPERVAELAAAATADRS